MAKTKGKKAAGAKGKAAKPKKTSRQAEKASEPKVSQAELDALRKPIEAAKGGLEKAQVEAEALVERGRAIVAEAKDTYRAVLAPYRDACRQAGVECEYEGGRSANVSEKVSFLVENTDRGVRVMVKGRPKTEETIPPSALKESINKAACAYTDKHVGPREKVGNKGGSLSKRLRAVLNA